MGLFFFFLLVLNSYDLGLSVIKLSREKNVLRRPILWYVYVYIAIDVALASIVFHLYINKYLS